MTQLGQWFTAGRCDNSGPNCVEIQFAGGGKVRVRDSKDPGGAVLTFDAGEWDAHVAGAKGGDLDLPERAR